MYGSGTADFDVGLGWHNNGFDTKSGMAVPRHASITSLPYLITAALQTRLLGICNIHVFYLFGTLASSPPRLLFRQEQLFATSRQREV